MYYLIESTLRECSATECHSGKAQYVAVLTPQEWAKECDEFEMGIDVEPDTVDIHNTKVEVNYDSLTGTFAIPNRQDISGEDTRFAFALDEKGIVFIDHGDGALEIIRMVMSSKKWRAPSLERFLYDFLEQIIHGDLILLERYEKELDAIDDRLAVDNETDLDRVDDIRSDLRDLRSHYVHLMDMAQELEENENNFFKSENIRFFRLFSNRVSRLHDTVTDLRDYTMQIRDSYESRLDVKQNGIMTVLTVVTTIFMPLTLIVGWYGMNFRYMPELDVPWAYPLVILICVVIVVVSLVFFKKKKWL